MNSIRFNKKPFQTIYKDFHSGEIKSIKRRPPEKLHDILPTDVVELSQKKSDDFQEGDEFSVKHISYRAPNTLQLVNEQGQSTFVSSSDVILSEKVAYRGKDQIDNEEDNRYLLWP